MALSLPGGTLAAETDLHHASGLAAGICAGILAIATRSRLTLVPKLLIPCYPPIVAGFTSIKTRTSAKSCHLGRLAVEKMTLNYDSLGTDLFESAFTDAVEVALSALGDTAKQMIYWYIFHDNTGLGAKGICQPEALSRSLEKVLGSGAARIEEIVLRELRATLELMLNEQGRTFVEVLACLKESMGHPS